MFSIERVVAFVLGPIIAAGSAWLAGAAGKYGLHLDKTGIDSLATTGAVTGLGLVWKWLHGRQKQLGPVEHELTSIAGTVERYDPGIVAELKTFVSAEIAKVAGLIPGGGTTVNVHPAAAPPTVVGAPAPATTSGAAGV